MKTALKFYNQTMKNLKLLLVAIVMITSYTLTAQVSITTDGADPHSSAMLELKSTDKGFLPPRMTGTEIGDIASPTDGLLVFNTDDNKVYIYVSTGNVWKKVEYRTDSIAAPGFKCGDALIDARDSKSYATVQIDAKCWMKENLNVGTQIVSYTGTPPDNIVNPQTDNDIIEKWCYNNLTIDCDVYGGLYQWAEMVQYLNGTTNTNTWDPVPTGNVQGICPTGWHVPTKAEYIALTDYLGGLLVAGDIMKETGTVHWNHPEGTNTSGFTAFGGGSINGDPSAPDGNSGASYQLKNEGIFRAATSPNAGGSRMIKLISDQSDAVDGGTKKWNGSSVRCVRD